MLGCNAFYTHGWHCEHFNKLSEGNFENCEGCEFLTSESDETDAIPPVKEKGPLNLSVKTPAVSNTINQSSEEETKLNILKPCPFCGGMAHISSNAKRKIHGKNEYRTGTAIYCGACEARMFYGSKKLAVEAWNRRADEIRKNTGIKKEKEVDYKKLRDEIHEILLDFFDHELEMNKGGEFDPEFLEFRTDEVLRLIQKCGGTY